jgi:anhydro-N-acetylmuramic acid kinase
MPKPKTPGVARLRAAIGLMSGTSLDGVDAALIRSDGRGRVEFGPHLTIPYGDALRAEVRAHFGKLSAPSALVEALTRANAEAVEALIAQHGVKRADIDVIGYHGQTIWHRPEAGETVQLGDGALLARLTGIDVVNDFRTPDVKAGGQGAPLVPIFHAALASALPLPVAVLNIGGVANVTWIGAAFDPASASPDDAALLAFDTGPGNALIDDWVMKHGGGRYDHDGRLARAGRVDEAAAGVILANGYFTRKPPKSLDRGHFDPVPVAPLSPEDGAATLVAVTARAVAKARDWFPAPARRWLVCGGGRHNPVIMEALRRAMREPVDPVEAVGWDGDATEAQAFAYLALRTLDGLPITFPHTTGAPKPMGGGTLHRTH